MTSQTKTGRANAYHPGGRDTEGRDTEGRHTDGRDTDGFGATTDPP